MVTIRGLINYKKKEVKKRVSTRSKKDMDAWRDKAIAAGKCPTCKKPKGSKECREWHSAYWKAYNEKRKQKRLEKLVTTLVGPKYT